MTDIRLEADEEIPKFNNGNAIFTHNTVREVDKLVRDERMRVGMGVRVDPGFFNYSQIMQRIGVRGSIRVGESTNEFRYFPLMGVPGPDGLKKKA